MLTRHRLIPAALAVAAAALAGCSNAEDQDTAPQDTPSESADEPTTDGDTSSTPDATETATACVLEPGDGIAVALLNRSWLSVEASIGAPDHVERLDSMDEAFDDAYTYLADDCLGDAFMALETEWIQAEAIARNGGTIPAVMAGELEEAGQAWYDSIGYTDAIFGQP